LEDVVTIVFCRHVCREWSVVLPPPSPELHPRGFLGTVAERGITEYLRWARERGYRLDASVTAGAARGGHLELLKSMRDEGCSWDERVTADAASRGHLEVLKWAREQGCVWSVTTSHCAARGGHLDVLKWAFENRCGKNEDTVECAVQGGHLDIIRYLKDVKWPGYHLAPRMAAAKGRVDLFEGMRRMGIKLLRHSILDAAASAGQIVVLEWAKKRNCSFAGGRGSSLQGWAVESVAVAQRKLGSVG